jgi:hypothetical protein
MDAISLVEDRAVGIIQPDRMARHPRRRVMPS